MLELIRKSLLAGLGAGVITKEKAEEAIRDLVAQGKLKAEDSKQLVDKLLGSGTKQWEEVQAGLTDAVRKALDGADVARGSQVEALTRRIESLEQRMKIQEDADS
jgi:polyhydroxyalkanoate synthesis regulator phasin